MVYFIKENELIIEPIKDEEYLNSLGFKKVEIEYNDCVYTDFNNDFTFNIEKYNSRKKIETIKKRIFELKQKLASYDYIGTKIATGRATKEEYATQIQEMIDWASEINELEEQLK